MTGAKTALLVSTILLCAFLFMPDAAADRGVFNAKLTPHETFYNAPDTVTVTAEVGAQNLYISSVYAYETNASGQSLRLLGRMYDDGTHGDETEADTVFTMQFTPAASAPCVKYVRVTAAYQGDRNRYLSPVLPLNIYAPIPLGATEDLNTLLAMLKQSYLTYRATMDPNAAREATLAEAKVHAGVERALLSDTSLCIVYQGVEGTVDLREDAEEFKGSSPLAALSLSTALSTLPSSVQYPGSNEVLLFAPWYTQGFTLDSDHASQLFDNAGWMDFSPQPSAITKDDAASLELIKSWGSNGAVIIDSHGGYLPVAGFWGLLFKEVVLLTGTPANEETQEIYEADIAAGRIVDLMGRWCIRPSYIREHCSSMENTFFFGAFCHSLHDNSMWNVLKGKGAKVMFGWSESVSVPFDATTFASIMDAMLPASDTTDPLTAQQAFDSLSSRTDPGTGAQLQLRTASADWQNFVFVEGGIINGNFETGDWTGWTTGGEYDYRIVAGARKHAGSFSGALGRWDTAYHGYDPTSEPYGYEWFYQDFVVPRDKTYLKFYWWMETYDTAVWDWFDAYICDTDGNVLLTLVNQGGKPGYNYGPYWTTQMADGGTGWREVKVDVSAFRGQKVRIFFDQRLDGYGDQQRVYVDDVTLE